MTSPQVQITDLPSTGSVSDVDYTILRKGLQDFKVAVGLLRQIDVSAYPLINTPSASDLMLINRGGSNYSVRFDRVGFVAGTTMWFYQDVLPLGWETIDAAGDALLGVVGGTNKYQSYGLKGEWQQPGHALTIDQMPAHSHRAFKTKETTGSSNRLGPVRGKELDPGNFQTESTGGEGSTAEIGQGKPALPHNHGSTWRPLANVGLLGRKMI